MILVNKDGKEYKRDECPLCDSESIEQGKCGDEWIAWSCNSCHAQWTEYLEFTKVCAWEGNDEFCQNITEFK